MDFNKIKELLAGLVNDSTSPEDMEKIGAIKQELDNASQEQNTFVEKYEDLRKKYVQALQDSSFKEKPKDEEKPMSLEDCIQEQIDNRK